ncbi:MAG: ABC transporter permease, partial [Muribaculaceae bacterium]|nr:ABC transporter permease [Muribaculaceae bacterium]
VFVSERETSLLVVVFTSLIFLFLSGLTWPRYAMDFPWRELGDIIPATWGVEGFVNINSNGATLSQVQIPYTMLWRLTAIYFLLACLLWKK